MIKVVIMIMMIHILVGVWMSDDVQLSVNIRRLFVTMLNVISFPISFTSWNILHLKNSAYSRAPFRYAAVALSVLSILPSTCNVECWEKCVASHHNRSDTTRHCSSLLVLIVNGNQLSTERESHWQIPVVQSLPQLLILKFRSEIILLRWKKRKSKNEK